ncbi:MAG: mannose-6-phosphate isomerase [Deltaproteobacteria bacterium]|nr:mannose-6-phosphate isomerase [Deltaproteobacteria bacterium]
MAPHVLPIPFADIRAWMFDEALPFWGTAGLDREHGGFLEELTLDGAETNVAFKRTRVTCRQIYVFSHAALLGWKPGEDLSARGYEALTRKAWLGPDRGWARRLTRDGGLLDATPDLYDLAFVLFALAWRYRLSADPDALTRLHATLDFIEKHMRPAGGEGFWHVLPSHGPRLQNPHMHLLEAALVAFEAASEQRFLDLASEIVALFRRRFFDGRTLAEFFTDDWDRVAGAHPGHLIEPGHHFEWAWILAQYQRLTGADVAAEATALVEFAERHGVDATTQLAYDEVLDDGTPLRSTSRTWPNTERIKGHLALFEIAGRDPRAPVASATHALLDFHLAVKPRGSWIDQFDPGGKPLSKVVPTSTLYHLFLAFAETLRLQPGLEALEARER